MDKWRKDEFDTMTCGEVALQVFGAEQDLEEAATVRAEAYAKLADAQKALDAAKEKVEHAATVERHFANEHKALKKYLNDRLGYK